MFDELLDLFERDRGGRRNGSRPSLFGRFFPRRDHDEDPRSPRRRYDPSDDGDDDARNERGRPRRRPDDFDLDD